MKPRHRTVPCPAHYTYDSAWKDKLTKYGSQSIAYEETTFEREITPLKNINDNYPKTIITLDRFTLGNYDGIEVENAIGWLLQK